MDGNAFCIFNLRGDLTLYPFPSFDFVFKHYPFPDTMIAHEKKKTNKRKQQL